jgi:hypothetical protein
MCILRVQPRKPNPLLHITLGGLMPSCVPCGPMLWPLPLSGSQCPRPAYQVTQYGTSDRRSEVIRSLCFTVDTDRNQISVGGLGVVHLVSYSHCESKHNTMAQHRVKAHLAWSQCALCLSQCLQSLGLQAWRDAIGTGTAVEACRCSDRCERCHAVIWEKHAVG